MASLSLRHIYKIYQGGVKAVSDFNLEIDDKEFIVFVGPSGCGNGMADQRKQSLGLPQIFLRPFPVNGCHK